MTLPSPREHDPDKRGAEEYIELPGEPEPAEPSSLSYPLTQLYLVLMVTFVLLAVLFEWRI